MQQEEKVIRIQRLLQKNEDFIGVQVFKDRIDVFVKSQYFFQEIKEPFEKILNVNVFCGKPIRKR